MRQGTSELKSCSAKVPEACPFFKRGMHFESVKEAEKFFASEVNSFTEVSVNRQNHAIVEEALLSIPNLGVKSAGLRGSYLYGLETPESDIDLMIITSGKGVRPRQYIVGDVDCLAHTLDSFMASVSEGQLAETDVLYSGQLFNGEYAALLRSTRVSPYIYYERSMGFSYNLLSTPPRQKGYAKGIKVASRNAILATKFYHHGHDFSPLLTPKEKGLLFGLTNESQQMLTKGVDPELVKDFVFKEALSLVN